MNLFMGPLSWLIEKLAGPWLRWGVVPVLFLALVVATSKIISDRDDRLRKEGEQACIDRHKLASIKAERDEAVVAANQSAAEVLARDQANRELENVKSRLATELSELRSSVRNGDDNCVSERVRDLILRD